MRIVNAEEERKKKEKKLGAKKKEISGARLAIVMRENTIIEKFGFWLCSVCVYVTATGSTKP